jgi:hypothetical protein
LRQTASDLFHFSRRLFRRDSGLKTTYRLIYTEAATLMIEVTIIQPPYVALKWKAEARCHYSDYSQCVAIDMKLTPDYRRIAAELSLPQAVTQDDRVSIFRRWGMAEIRRHPQG